jgi:serine/threonine protein phosphatase PrpC
VTATATEDETANPEIDQQADRSLSMAMHPDQAEALKNALEDFQKTSGEDSDEMKGTNKEDESVDTNEPVGQEEAAALDDNIDETNSGNDEAESVPATETTPAEVSPNGGKVTTMLQKILSLGGTADADADTNTDDADSEADGCGEPKLVAPVPQTAEALIDAPRYPDSSEVSGTSPRHPSVTHNGRLVCNLPDHPIHAGATAVVAVITGNIMTVANAGDSRAVLCRRRKAKGHYAYPLSYDHKPSQTHEMNRILRSGGFVNHFGRINGNLNLSRSIGDLKYKQVPGIPPAHQMITAEPDIMQISLQDDDEFLLLGCDGIWDCLSNEQAVDFVMNRIDTRSPTEIGAEMLDQIISEDPRVTQGIGGDNMTIMIVDFKAEKRSRKAVAAASETGATEKTPVSPAEPGMV